MAVLRRLEQAGAADLAGVPQRDWARGEHYDEVMATLKAHCSIY
jgi:hypothetical protein